MSELVCQQGLLLARFCCHLAWIFCLPHCPLQEREISGQMGQRGCTPVPCTMFQYLAINLAVIFFYFILLHLILNKRNQSVEIKLNSPSFSMFRFPPLTPSNSPLFLAQLPSWIWVYFSSSFPERHWHRFVSINDIQCCFINMFLVSIVGSHCTCATTCCWHSLS